MKNRVDVSLDHHQMPIDQDRLHGVSGECPYELVCGAVTRDFGCGSEVVVGDQDNAMLRVSS
jgi:hypothetical protein